MNKLIAKTCKFVFRFVLISAMIYFGIIAVLMLTGKPKEPDQAQRGPAFDELFFDYSSLPELKSSTARDGTRLAYRHYPAESDKIVILLLEANTGRKPRPTCLCRRSSNITRQRRGLIRVDLRSLTPAASLGLSC